MECTGWKEALSALTDGELSDEEAAALFSHLAGCPACRIFYRHLIFVREHLSQSVPEGGSSSQRPTTGWTRPMPGDVHPAFEARRRGTPLRISRTIAAVVTIALLVLGGSTTALLLEQSGGSAAERVIFVGTLPTVEVEAAFLSNSTKGL